MSRLIKNWSYLLFSDLSQAGINFFVFIILARKLSPEGFGQLNIVLAIFMLFTVFANNLGANHVITREITLRPESVKKLLSKLVPLRIFSFIATTIAMIIYVLNTNNWDLSIVVFASILVFSNSVWDLSESVAFGMLVTKFTTIFNLIFSSIWLLSAFLIPCSVFNVKNVLLVYCSLFLLKSISYLVTIIKKYTLGNFVSIISSRSIILMSLPYLFMRGLGSFVDQIPVLMLNSNSGSKEVGYFSVGLRLIIPITLTVSTALRAVFPFITRLYEKDKMVFEKKVIESFGFVFIWGTIMATILVNTSDFWIPFFFGKEYLFSVKAFNVLAWYGVGMCFDLLFSTILSSTYKQNTLAVITAIDFTILLPFLYFGSYYGALGLAIAKLISLLFILTYHIIVIKKVLKINIYNKQFFYSILFFLLMMGVSFLGGNLWMKIIFLVTVIFFYTLFEKSPLRQSIQYIVKLVFKK